MKQDDQNARLVVNRANTINRLQFHDALHDIVRGLRMRRIWSSLAWFEFTSTYRRSALGVLWIVLSFAAFIFVKLIIFSSLLSASEPGYYESYLVLGFFVWIYQMQSVTGAPDTFVSARGWITSEDLPLSLYVFKSITREIYNLLLTSTVVIAALLYIGYPLASGAAFAALGLIFLIVNSFFLKLLLGLLSARFRDIAHFVKAIMQTMLFLTPIFWMPEQMGRLMDYLWWNPFFHYLEIFRAPLLTGEFPTSSWIYVLSLWSIITIAGVLLFARYRQRIAFWV